MSSGSVILCVMVYSAVLTKAKLDEVYNEYWAECKSLHNLGGSQSDKCWASWHSGLNVLREAAVITIK